MSIDIQTTTQSIPATQDQPDLNMTAKASAWLDALRAVGIAVSTRPAVPILAHVLVRFSAAGEGVTLTGTDYVTRVTAQVASAVGTGADEGLATIPFHWLQRTIRTLTRTDTSMDVTVSTTGLMGQRMASVQAAGYTIPLLAGPVNDFPAEEQHAALGTFTTNLDNFRTALDRVQHAASIDDTLPILTSIHLQGRSAGVHVMATDRYRLAFNHLQLEEGETSPNFDFNLRSQVWGKLSKILHGETVGVTVLARGGSHGLHGGGLEALEIRTKGLTVQIMATDGEYPKILTLTQFKAGATAVVSRAELLRQARIALDLSIRNVPAEVRISAAGLSVTPGLGDFRDDTKAPLIPTTFWTHTDQVSEILTAFNTHYLMEAVQAFAGVEDLKITLATLGDGVAPAKPVMITAADKKHDDETAFRTMVMPVRLPNLAV